MVKFNKQIWAAIACALFGINNVKAESSEIMNHRIVAKGAGIFPLFHVNNMEDAVKAITGVNDAKNESFKFLAGFGVEYNYWFNPYFGAGLDVLGGYRGFGQYRWRDDASGKENVIDLGLGCCLNTDVKVLVNFLSDGFSFDEEEGCAAGLKAGAYCKSGVTFNFGDPKYDENGALKDKKNQVVFARLNPAVEVGAFFELPCGLGGELGGRGLFGNILRPAEIVDGNEKKNEGNKLMGKVVFGVTYNFANLIY